MQRKLEKTLFVGLLVFPLIGICCKLTIKIGFSNTEDDTENK